MIIQENKTADCTISTPDHWVFLVAQVLEHGVTGADFYETWFCVMLQL